MYTFFVLDMDEQGQNTCHDRETILAQLKCAASVTVTSDYSLATASRDKSGSQYTTPSAYWFSEWASLDGKEPIWFDGGWERLYDKEGERWALTQTKTRKPSAAHVNLRGNLLLCYRSGDAKCGHIGALCALLCGAGAKIVYLSEGVTHCAK